MADEAQLKIKPVLSGTSGLFSPLQRGLKGVAATGRRVAGTIKGAFSRLASVQGLLVSGAMYGAGRTFYDMTLGAADNTAMAETRMKSILGSAREWKTAQGSINELLLDIPSLDKGQAMKGIERFLSITQGSVEASDELMRISAALSAVNPGEGIEGASFSLKELIGEGSGTSLRDRFGIKLPTQQEAKKLAKEDGQSLEVWYKDELLRKLAQMYGKEEDTIIDFLLGVRRDSIGGKLAQIKSVVSNTFESIGKEARKPVLSNISEVAEKWTKMAESPEFKGSITRLSEFFAESAGALTGALPGIIDKIPGAMESTMDAIKTARDFYNEHPGLIKFLGTAAAANWLTGGMLTQMGGSIVGSLVGKATGGKGGVTGGIGCCCDGAGGVGGKGKRAGDVADLPWYKKVLNYAKSGGATTSTLTASTGVLSGGQVAIGAGAMALPFAIGGAGLYSWGKALNAEADVGKSSAFDSIMAENWGKRWDGMLKQGNYRQVKADIMGMLGGPDAEFGSDRQEDILDVINQALDSRDIEVEVDDGQSVRDLLFDDESWFGGKSQKLAENMNRVSVTVMVPATATGVDGEQVKQMAQEGAEQGLKNAGRTAKATR